MKRIISGVMALTFGATASATQTNPMDQIFAAVDLSSIMTFVAGAAVIIIGIFMAFKGIDLAKRAVKKA